MPGIPISSIVNSLAPILIPSGSQNSVGPGGVQQVPPNQWNPRFDAEQPPAQIPNAEALNNYVLDQDVNNSRNSALSEQQLTNNNDINGEVNQIIERNKKTLGLTGGANGFYDINLVRPASGRKGFIEDEEPDGFRLYLVCPPNPSGAVQLAANMIGTAATTATNAIAGAAGVAANVAGSEVVGTVAALGAGTEGAQLAQDASKNIREGGEKVAQVGKAIAEKMNLTKQAFDDKFNKYVQKSYDNAQGNSFYSIVLPMPKELTDSHQHELDNIMMGFLPRAAAGLGIGFNNFSNSIASKFKDTRAKRTTGQSEGALGELFNAATLGLGSVAAEAGAYTFDSLRARIGVGLNPNVETIYAAPKQRSFQFTFELYIKSREESTIVKDFINRIKQHSYPLSVLGIGGQSQLYLNPGEVYFEFCGRYRNNLFRSLRPCIITNIQVQYSNQDQYQHFEDGSSIVYIVSIQLVENKLLDRNILVDDAEENAGKSFADKDFRNSIKFRDTFMGESFQNFGERPQDAINGISNTLGLGDVVQPFQPPTTPDQQQGR
jgi:hypothetical protein